MSMLSLYKLLFMSELLIAEGLVSFRLNKRSFFCFEMHSGNYSLLCGGAAVSPAASRRLFVAVYFAHVYIAVRGNAGGAYLYVQSAVFHRRILRDHRLYRTAFRI